MIRRSRSRLLALTVLLVALATGCTQFNLRKSMNEAHRLFNQKKYEEAVTAYEKVLTIDSSNWTAKFQIALAYMALYHPGSNHPKDKEFATKAIAGFEGLLNVPAPDAATEEKVREYYSAMLASAEEFDKAIAYYEAILAKEPKNTKAVEKLATLYHDDKKQFSPAMKYYEMLAELEPTKEHFYIVGQRYWNRSFNGAKEGTISIEERQNCINKGMEYLDKAMKLDPNYFEPTIYQSLLWRQKQQVAQDLGDLVTANDAFQKAEELKKKAVEIRAKQPKNTPAVPNPA